MCSSELDRFGCLDASSAIDATVTTPRSYAASMACWAAVGFVIAPSASWITRAPWSSAKSTPAANRCPSATNESPTLTGTNWHFGQVPTSPVPFAAATESSASPVPWP